jgi:diacylglycerol O-acyltransferase
VLALGTDGATALAPQDVARLRMAAPENPMVITAALLLERPVGHGALVDLLEARLLRQHERFRKRVVQPRLGAPRWEDVARLDLREHCAWHTHRFGRPSLEDVVEDRMSEPLDGDRPLWRMDVLEGVEGGAALVFRVHHVLADGEALVAILGGLADGAARCGDAVSGQAGAFAAGAPGAGGRLLRVLGGVTGASRLVLRSPDPTWSGRGRPGPTKRVACSSPLPLPTVAARAHAARATITEVLLAAVARALSAPQAARGGPNDTNVHALVPASLHQGGRGDTGNDYASVFVTLPVGRLAPEERVRRVAESLRVARSRGGLRASARLVGAASAVGRPLERLAVTFLSRRASVVVSSVRGPSTALRVGGASLRDVIVWAPPPGQVPLSVTLMSYAGRIRIGVLADAHVVGDPAPIVRALESDLGGARTGD